jgi:hypothetical protein
MRILTSTIALCASFSANNIHVMAQPCQGGIFDKGNGSPSQVPSHVLEKFLAKTQVKKGQEYRYQEVNDNSVQVGENTISLDENDLDPVGIMSEGAHIIIDNVAITFPPLVFQSKEDPSVTITKDANGKLLSAIKRGTGNGRGVNLDVLSLYDDTFVTIDKEDIDDALMAEFGDKEVKIPGSHRKLQSNKHAKPIPHDRSLQTMSVLLD